MFPPDRIHLSFLPVKQFSLGSKMRRPTIPIVIVSITGYISSSSNLVVVSLNILFPTKL